MFSDLHGHWAQACIQALAERNVVDGYPDGSFRPDALVSRAEAAAFLIPAFSDAPLIREAIPFQDVATGYWAHAEIQWAFERGFFSGYPDQSFQPEGLLTRIQAQAILSSGLHLAAPPEPWLILRHHYDDAGNIADWAIGAVAAATEAKLVVNAPDVRRLRGDQPASRAEMAAFFCRALAIPNSVPFQFIAWDLRLEDISSDIVIRFDDLQGRASLVRELQQHLYDLRLYPGGPMLDGIVGPRLQAALTEFARLLNLAGGLNGLLDEPYARALLSLEPVAFVLEQARDRATIFSEYLQQEQDFDASHLAFLDRGAEGSPLYAQIGQYTDRLRQGPDQIEVVSPGAFTGGSNSGLTGSFGAYPERGVLPAIDDSGLDFLHDDIERACLCTGRVVEGQMRAHWLGKQALVNGELWSCTKLIPLLQVVSQSNWRFPGADLDTALVRPLASGDGRNGGGASFNALAVDMFSYAKTIGSSNAIAAMFKQFSRPDALETWLKQITGNAGLTFRGRYGEAPLIAAPQLWDSKRNRVLLHPSGADHDGSNSISTYDLVRMITLLGWHPHIPLSARLPGAQWDSLEGVARASAMDTARYVDVALDRLNLYGLIKAPVILSKLGFGRSRIRDQTELAYVAFVQFIDKRQWADGQPAIMRSLAMALIAAKDLGDPNQEARELDARMSAEVTEILRRVVSEELA